MVNLVSIQQSLRSTETFLFFPQNFGSPPKFHDMFTVCYFLLLTRMCRCETITLARRVIGMKRLYEGKEEIALQTIYRLPNISPFQNDLSVMPYITYFL